MEGRISRESLMTNTPKPEPPPSYDYSRYTPRRSTRTAQGGSYRRRGYSSAAKKREAIPKGADLFIVQALSSGILLLFIMFVSIVNTSQTVEIKQKLKEAFSKNTTIEEFADSTLKMKDKVAVMTGLTKDDKTGGEATEAELPGGEAPLEPADIDTLPSESEEVLLDSDILNQINEYEENGAKN